MVITLDKPRHGNDVGYSLKVKGRVFPCDAFVQVLVLSADNKWYTQKLCKKHRHHFECDVKVGFQHPNAKVYTIAAGTGPRILESRIDELPSDTLWTTVAVDRIP